MALSIVVADSVGNNTWNLTANGVNIGVVSDTMHQLLWSVGIQPSSQVKFSIRDAERLAKILDALVDYKNQNGYEDVIIKNCVGDIGTFFTEEEWNNVGYELAEGGSYYRTKK